MLAWHSWCLRQRDIPAGRTCSGILLLIVGVVLSVDVAAYLLCVLAPTDCLHYFSVCLVVTFSDCCFDDWACAHSMMAPIFHVVQQAFAVCGVIVPRG